MYNHSCSSWDTIAPLDAIEDEVVVGEGGAEPSSSVSTASRSARCCRLIASLASMLAFWDSWFSFRVLLSCTSLRQ
jgi:hypothetical protein